MSFENVNQKLESAGIQPEKWMNLEKLMFSNAFNTFSDAELNVFFGWFKELTQVVRFLESGKLTQEFIPNKAITENAQFDRFREIATALLVDGLKKQVIDIKDYNHAKMIVSYSVLLNDACQDDIQDEVGYWMNSQLNKFNDQIQKSNSDQQIYNYFYHNLNNDFWQLMNKFNVRHYRIKASWLESLLSLIRHKKASSRLIKSIIAKLELLELNSDHKAELRNLDQQIRTRKIKFESKKIPWVRLFLIFFVIAAISFGITYIMLIKPEPYVAKIQDETSFLELSEEDTKEIDSLIKIYDNNHTQQQQSVEDVYFQTPPTQLITLNSSNQGLFWQYFRAWHKHEKDPFTNDFHVADNKHKTLPGTSALSTKKGNLKGTFYNESSVSALVIVYDDTDADKMYCKYIQPKEHVVFHIDESVEKLVVVPGGKIKSKLSKSELPFDEINEHFYRQLERIYSIQDASNPMKLVYKDMGANGVVLIDLNKSLTL